MARRRFLTGPIRDNIAELRGEDARHLSRVLRAEPGQQYEISDGAGVYLAEITSVEKERVLFHIVEPIDTPPLPVQLTLLAALIKFDRFEWLVEKATELGVSTIIPVNAARSEKGLMDAARKRSDRWRRIAHESSQQSRRLAPPEIGEAQSLAAVLGMPFDFRAFLDEQPGTRALSAAFPPPSERHPAAAAALLIGPEGGWTDAERASAVSAGWKAVSLGPTILRAETAALAAVAVLTHAWWTSRLE